MAERRVVTSFNELASTYLDNAPPGTIALHAMLGVVYPTDEALSKEQLAANVAEYAKRVATYAAAGIIVQRLVLGPAGCSPTYLEHKRWSLAPVIAAGEDVRIADLAQHGQSLEKMRKSSPLAISHWRGIETQTPRSSFWMLDIPSDGTVRSTRLLTWIMNYQRGADGQLVFSGGPLYEAAVEPKFVTDWREYWREVFSSSPQLLPER